MAKKKVEQKRPPGRPRLSPEEKELRRLERNRKDRLKRRVVRETLEENKRKKEQQEKFKRLSNLPPDEEPPVEVGKPVSDAAGPGRPKGSKSKTILSYASVRKLEELGFDPLEKLTELYIDIQNMLVETYVNKEGVEVPRVKVGSMAHATLLSQLKGITETLAKYGYRAVPEKKEIETTDKVPTIVNLSLSNKKAAVEKKDE